MKKCFSQLGELRRNPVRRKKNDLILGVLFPFPVSRWRAFPKECPLPQCKAFPKERGISFGNPGICHCLLWNFKGLIFLPKAKMRRRPQRNRAAGWGQGVAAALMRSPCCFSFMHPQHPYLLSSTRTLITYHEMQNSAPPGPHRSPHSLGDGWQVVSRHPETATTSPCVTTSRTQLRTLAGISVS